MSRSVLAAAIVLSALALGVRPCQAQVHIGVNTLVDLPDFDLLDGICDCDSVTPGPQCSLRAAIQNANLLGGWVIVNLGAQVYGLSFGGTDDLGVAGDLDVYSGILSRLEINGVPGTVITAAGLSSGGTPDRILHLTSSLSGACEVIISDLTIRDGAGVALGAGIRQDAAQLSLNNVFVASCAANDSGGGVYVQTAQTFAHNGGGYTACSAAFVGGGLMLDGVGPGGAQLSNVSIAACSAGTLGGGMRVAAGATAVMLNSNIGPGNTASAGAGISNRGTLTALDTTINDNTATGTGGGIANNIGAVLTLERCTISGNQANTGGGLNNSATAVLNDCRFSLNTADTAGGISNTARMLTVRRCTISGNTATGAFGGGGYRGFGGLDMVNSTISGNNSSGFGGGIYFDGGLFPVEISASTIAFNQCVNGGGGIFTDNSLGSSPFSMIGSIIADNTFTSGVSNNFVGSIAITSAGFNLDTDGSCLLVGPGDHANVPALLEPLQNNGGFTDTHALMPGSPAINAGACFTVNGNAITTDQRLMPRGVQCDTGSYEAMLQPPPNDLCISAAPVGPGSFVFTHLGANTDGPAEACGFTGLPGQDSDVWFQYVAPCGGTTTIMLHPTPVPPAPPDRLLAIYTQCPAAGGPGPLVCVLSAPAAGTIAHVAGEVFIIRAGMPNGLQADSVLDITVACSCPVDIVPNNAVDVDDLIAVILGWGPCPAPCPPRCAADVAPIGPPQGDCVVNVDDLIAVILGWGPCP